MDETMKVIIMIRKKDLQKFVDKFQVEEYTVNNRKQEVTINMTEIFAAAEQQYSEKQVTTSESSLF